MYNDEIKDIAPQLTQLKLHNAGFNLPHDYFETVEEKIVNEIKLASFKNEISFKVPDKYFDTLSTEIALKNLKSSTTEVPFKVPIEFFDSVESKVQAKIESQNKNSLFTLTRFWIPFSVAAMLVLTVGIVKFNSETPSQSAQVEVGELEEWLENGSVDINSYEIASIYETELAQINPTDFLNEKEIEDYLQNDINQLYYE